jgi:hypothetical protein
MSTIVNRLKTRMRAGSIPVTFCNKPASSMSPAGVRRGLSSQGWARVRGSEGTTAKIYISSPTSTILCDCVRV